MSGPPSPGEGVRDALLVVDVQTAFALPATCAPEGYAAARARGQLRLLPPGGRAGFSVRTGYLDAAEAPAFAARIGAMALRGEYGS